MALRVGLGSATEPGGRAPAVDLAIRNSRLAPRGDTPIAALADHAAMADVRTVSADVQIQVVSRTDGTRSGTDGIGQRDTIRPRPDGESVTVLDAILGAVLRFRELRHNTLRFAASGYDHRQSAHSFQRRSAASDRRCAS